MINIGQHNLRRADDPGAVLYEQNPQARGTPPGEVFTFEADLVVCGLIGWSPTG